MNGTEKNDSIAAADRKMCFRTQGEDFYFVFAIMAAHFYCFHGFY